MKDTGLRRTYPNWLSREGARGQEYNAWGSPPNPLEHVAMLPFTRNLFDPMDFTPVVFGDIPNIKRATRNGFELAQAVLFLSRRYTLFEGQSYRQFVEAPPLVGVATILTIWRGANLVLDALDDDGGGLGGGVELRHLRLGHAAVEGGANLEQLQIAKTPRRIARCRRQQ